MTPLMLAAAEGHLSVVKLLVVCCCKILSISNKADGLGLAIVKHVLLRHEAYLGVESKWKDSASDRCSIWTY